MFEYHEIVSMLNLQHFNVGHRKTWRGFGEGDFVFRETDRRGAASDV